MKIGWHNDLWLIDELTILLFLIIIFCPDCGRREIGEALPGYKKRQHRLGSIQ